MYKSVFPSPCKKCSLLVELLIMNIIYLSDYVSKNIIIDDYIEISTETCYVVYC